MKQLKLLELQASNASQYRTNAVVGQGRLPSKVERRLLLKDKEQTSCVDIGWDTEQCLDFLEMLAQMLHGYGKSSDKDLEIPSSALRHLGFSMFEAVAKIREEFKDSTALPSRKGGAQ